MILMLAPAADMNFASLPSGSTYVSDANALVYVTNNSVADQLALVAAGCKTLSPIAGGATSAQPGTSYTVQQSDSGNTILFTNAAAVAATLPNSFPVGFWVELLQAGSGQVSAVAQSGGSIVTPNLSATPNQYSSLFCLVIANASGTNAQWDVIAEPMQTGAGFVGASSLANLYTQDTSAHYAQYTIAQVFADGTTSNDGFWLKTGSGNGSGNWTQQSTLTLANLSAAVTAETTRAEAAEANLQASIASTGTYIWADDGFFSWGVWDANGHPIFAMATSGQLLGSAADFLNGAYIWADEGFGSGVGAIVDPNGIVLPPYGAAPGLLDEYCPYIGGDGNVYATNGEPVIASGRPAIAVCLGAARGTIRSAPQGKNFNVKWIDDGTGLGDALPTKRNFDWRGGAYLAAQSITNLICIIDIGHSLTVGGTAGILTTTAPFARAAMFTGGPKVVQASPVNTGNRNRPAPIIADRNLQFTATLYEYQSYVTSQGESHGGGICTWLSGGSNVGTTDGIVFASVGAGGAILTDLLSDTNQFVNLQRVAERAAALAKFNGWSVEFWVACSIGENDYVTYATNAAAFQSNLLALQSSISTMLSGILTRNGFTPPANFPLICRQPSSWTSSTYNLATCALVPVFASLAIADPTLFALVGPDYFAANYNSADTTHVHKTALGYKLDGEYLGRVIQKLRAAGTSPGLYATGVSNSGNALTITTNAQSNLAIDTSVVSDPGQSGLRVLDVTAGNAAIALSSIAVSGTTIAATLASHTAGHTLMLGIADIGTAGNTPGPTTGPRSTIRDSSADVSSADTGSTAMVNYMSHQQLQWMASA